MNKVLALGFLMLFLHRNGLCQIEKGDWLVGGSAAFSSQSQPILAQTQTTIVVNTSLNAGYFPTNRLALGLKPSYSLENVKRTGDNHSRTNSWYIGPFARFYILPNERMFNFFAEGSYVYGIGKLKNQYTTQKTHLYRYMFLGGPVIFLNSSVGLEFTVGYSVLGNNAETKNKVRTIQTGIGLQFHLSNED